MLITYIVEFGFFIKWHINHQELFNTKVIFAEKQPKKKKN